MLAYIATFCRVSSASRASRSLRFLRATESGVTNLGCGRGEGGGGCEGRGSERPTPLRHAYKMPGKRL